VYLHIAPTNCSDIMVSRVYQKVSGVIFILGCTLQTPGNNLHIETQVPPKTRSNGTSSLLGQTWVF
jgi:hypothetical protein